MPDFTLANEIMFSHCVIVLEEQSILEDLNDSFAQFILAIFACLSHISS